MPPLLIVHLLGQRADDLARRAERFGDQRVTGGAELGLADVRRLCLLEAGDRVHDAPPPGIGRERAERAAPFRSGAAARREVAVEALARAETLGARSDGRRCTSRHRAASSVDRPPARPRRLRQCAKTLPPCRPPRARSAAPPAGGTAAHSSSISRGVRRVVDRLAPEAGEEVRIARRVGHHRAAPARADRHVLARGRRRGCCGRPGSRRRREQRRVERGPARWRRRELAG